MEHTYVISQISSRPSIMSRLSSERALASPSECAAIVFATMECLRFFLLQNSGDEPEQRDVQNALITQQVSSCAIVSCVKMHEPESFVNDPSVIKDDEMYDASYNQCLI